jgi:hypothetical protein
VAALLAQELDVTGEWVAGVPGILCSMGQAARRWGVVLSFCDSTGAASHGGLDAHARDQHQATRGVVAEKALGSSGFRGLVGRAAPSRSSTGRGSRRWVEPRGAGGRLVS